MFKDSMMNMLSSEDFTLMYNRMYYKCIIEPQEKTVVPMKSDEPSTTEDIFQIRSTEFLNFYH